MMEWACSNGTVVMRGEARGRASVIGDAGRFAGKDLRGLGPACAGVTGEMECEGGGTERELPMACCPHKGMKTGYFDGNGGEEPG